MKIEQKYLDGSAFAIAFLRDKHAGATVRHMHLWTHNISLSIDLSLWPIKQEVFIS